MVTKIIVSLGKSPYFKTLLFYSVVTPYHFFMTIMPFLKRPLTFVFLCSLLLMASGAQAGQQQLQITELWQCNSGLANPESVLFDPTTRILLVSNVAGKPLAKDGNGFIAKVALNGVLLDSQWITGLNAPKGMALVNDTLYIADIDELVVVNWTDRQQQRFTAPGARFLNDVTAAANGDLFISDMYTNTIWRFGDGRLEKWLVSDQLPGPNGLLIKDNALYVACWGTITNGFATSRPGQLKRVDLQKKTISLVGSDQPLGHLDGLAKDHHDGFWLTDYMAGKLMRLDGQARLLQQLELGQGSADLAVLPKDWEMLVVPMMQDNSLRGFRVE